MTTVADLARELGVAKSTVSRALADSPLISEPTRRTVRELAQARSYVVPQRKPRARMREPQTTIVMPPYLSQQAFGVMEPFFPSLFAGIATAMRERDLSFKVTNRVVHDEGSLRDLVNDNPEDGFILLGQGQLHHALNVQAELGRALVVWGPKRKHQIYCSVGGDDVGGSFRATAHLLKLGRRRIAFLGTPACPETQDRLEGYRSALRAHRIGYDSELEVMSESSAYDGNDAVDELLSRKVSFDGIVAATDILALGAIRALARSGLSVPADVSVIGYDDLDIAAHASPALTTVRKDPLKAGRLLTAKLTRLLAGQRAPSERLPTELIARESCGG